MNDRPITDVRVAAVILMAVDYLLDMRRGRCVLLITPDGPGRLVSSREFFRAASETAIALHVGQDSWARRHYVALTGWKPWRTNVTCLLTESNPPPFDWQKAVASLESVADAYYVRDDVSWELSPEEPAP